MRQKSTKKRQYSIVGLAMIVSLVFVFLAAAPALADTFYGHSEARNPPTNTFNQMDVQYPEATPQTYTKSIASGTPAAMAALATNGEYWTNPCVVATTLPTGNWVFHTWIWRSTGTTTTANYCVRVYKQPAGTLLFTTPTVTVGTSAAELDSTYNNTVATSMAIGDSLRFVYWITSSSNRTYSMIIDDIAGAGSTSTRLETPTSANLVQPLPPTIGPTTPLALSTTSIRWYFTDTATNEVGFKVHDSSHNIMVQQATANLTYFDEASLSPNTQYTRHVVSYATMDSSDSANASGYTLVNVPASASATAVSPTQINVSWTAPGSGTASSYHLYRTDNLVTPIYSGSNLSYNDTDVSKTPNNQYTYRVYSVNGDGVESATYATVSKYTLANVPASASATAASSSQINVSWTAPGSGTASGYHVYSSSDSYGSIKYNGTNLSWNETSGLSANTQYTYRAYATNGDGVESATYATVSKYTLCNVPASASATAASTTQINVSWTAPGSGTASSYHLYRTDNLVTPIYSGSNLSYNDSSGLSVNTQYTYRVYAANGDGVESATYATVSGYTLSANPASIAASDGAFTDRIRVSWPASASANHYHVYKDGSNLTGTLVHDSTGLTFDDMYPTSGSHTYRVYSVNSANVLNTIDSAVSDTGYKIIPPPNAPTIGTPAATGTTSIRWNFTDTNTTENGFKVHNSTDTVMGTNAAPNQTYVNETGLTPNTSYPGRHIHAYNAAGDSPASGPASCYTLSNPPTGANATDGAFADHINISWTAPADTNPPNHYHVYRDGTTLLPDVFTTNVDDDPGGRSPHTYYIYSVNSDTPGVESSSYISDSGYTEVSLYPHGGFSNDTEACAACHRAHTAQSEYLIASSSGNALCMTCHWGGSGGNTDVKNGVYNVGGESNLAWGENTGTLLAGGFVNVGNTASSTSMHILDTALKPPGSTTGGVITLNCLSCHSPHMNSGSESQYRLLRLRPNGAASDKVVAWNGPWTNNTQTTYQANGYRAYTEKDWNPYLNGVQVYTHNYKSGLSDWCISCHTLYKTPTDSAPYDPGDTVDPPEIRYRHTMDNVIKGVVDETTGLTYDLDSELPLEQVNGSVASPQDKVMCLTCHRAHGTDVTITARIVQYYNIDRGVLPKGSTLLRKNNTGVCVDCHTNI